MAFIKIKTYIHPTAEYKFSIYHLTIRKTTFFYLE